MARITVTIEGSTEDKGHVRLTEFIKQLEAVRSSLKQTERLVSNSDTPSLYYRIVELTYSSPARVVIEPSSIDPNSGDLGIRTVRKFVTNLRQVSNGRRPAQVDLSALQSYQNLTSMLRQHIGKVEIRNGDKPVVIDNKFAKRIAKIIGPDEIAEGSVSGMLEWLNLHNANRFHIYPTVGPHKVDCDFPAHLRPQVIAAVDKYVQVIGQLRYKHLEKFPYAINVNQIDVLPSEDDLPTLYDLRGIAQGATGDMSAADFVRALRDEAR